MGRRLQPDRRLQELESIYREHHRRVRWVLRSRGVRDDALDDLAQEAFLTIFRRLPERDPALPMGTWITGITRNVAFSYRRSTARRIAATRELPAPTAELELDEAVRRRRAWVQLQGFLDGLDDDQREVFVLSDLLGMRVPEVAHVVDAPLNTLYSRLRLARRRFHDHFGPDPARQLQQAGRGEAPSPSERRHAWLAITAKLPALTPVAATSTGSLGSLGFKWLLAGGLAAAGVVTTAAVVRATDTGSGRARAVVVGEASDRAVAGGAPSVGPAPTPLPAAASSSTEAPVVSAQPDPPSPAPRRAASPRPTATANAPHEARAPAAPDPLEASVEALRAAQRRVREGRPAEALAILDALVRDHAEGPLPRERLRLEREAACAAGLSVRATAARDRLVRLGAVDASAPACEAEITGP